MPPFTSSNTTSQSPAVSMAPGATQEAAWDRSSGRLVETNADLLRLPRPGVHLTGECGRHSAVSLAEQSSYLQHPHPNLLFAPYESVDIEKNWPLEGLRGMSPSVLGHC